MSGPSANKRLSESPFLVPALLSAGVLFRVLSFFFSKNCGGDAAGRLTLTSNWIHHPNLRLVFLDYPPGHFWLMAGLAAAIRDVTTSGRLLSLLLGIASLFFVFKLARTLYSKGAAALSLAVFAFYSLHIGYSATSSSEVPQVFFLLVALFFFFSYFREENKRRLLTLAISGLALSVAESIRYEAWVVFIALLLVFPLLWIRARIQPGGRYPWLAPLLVFGSTGGAWPAVMMTYCWRLFGDPMYQISSTHARMARVLEIHGNSLAYEFALIPTVLLITLSLLALGAAIYGIIRSFRLPVASGFAAITLFFLAVQNYEILHGGFLAVARYSLTPGILLCVTSGEGLEAICEKLFPTRVNSARIGIIALLFLNMMAVWAVSDLPNRYADRFAPISPRLRYPSRIAQVGEYLRTHLEPQDAVVIDDYNVEANVLADAAGLPIVPGRRAYLVGAKQSVGVREYIQTERPRFVVYSDQGTLRNDFELPRNCNETVTIWDVEFRCRFSNKVYRVYELRYIPEGSEASTG